MNRMDQLKEYRDWADSVQAQTGKNLLVQLREILALKQAGGQCGITDYYWYKLYDDSYQLGRGGRDYLGWKLQAEFSLSLNPRNAVLPAWDKIVFFQLASAAGLPVVPSIACYHPAKRLPEALGLHLRSRQEVAGFLRDETLYPLFAKPAYSQQGYGSTYIAGYRPEIDSLALLDGSTVQMDQFLKRLEEPIDYRYHKPECGFLFQKPIKLAPEIQTLTNWPAVCGVRIICLNGKGGVKPIRAIWKVAMPPNHVDNFSLGKYGNLLADINVDTGEVSRFIQGFWPNSKVHFQHPHSGKSLAGIRLSGWRSILDACKLGGAVFPLMKLHHWDFALTDQGPMILELNDIGGTEIAQVHGRGLLTEETRAFLKQNANPKSHLWVSHL